MRPGSETSLRSGKAEIVAQENLLISEFDQHCLLKLLTRTDAGAADGDQHRHFIEQLHRATVVAPESVPEDLVTMHSRVRLVEQRSRKRMTIKLVFPSESERNKQQRISVLEPIGAAILGRKEGDIVEVAQGTNHNSFKIDKVVYQPEADGWLL